MARAARAIEYFILMVVVKKRYSVKEIQMLNAKKMARTAGKNGSLVWRRRKAEKLVLFVDGEKPFEAKVRPVLIVTYSSTFGRPVMLIRR